MVMKAKKAIKITKRTVFVFKSKSRVNPLTTEPTTSLTDTLTTTSKVL